MAIASQTLSQLQAAGSAVNAAGLALQQELQAHSHALMEQMAMQPFGPEVDGAYQQMRQVARLVHEMNSLEQQLKAIYLDAAQKVQAEVPVLPALPSVTRRRRVQDASVVSSPELIEDAKVVSKGEGKRKPSKRPATVKPSAVVDKPKLANSELLLKALKKILRKQAKAVGHVEMAKVSGLPRGSIGASIKKLVETNKLVVESNGFFKLV
ncbi:MAG: hypothetical protein JZU58_10990 [Curvibacter lanceolatus]|nr:hypothetical protein [Curvibacter lanceolatus]